ncbi:MAG: response regulator transcription factor [Rhodospirillales bacterium]
MTSEAIVFVVDDDAAVRDSLKALLESADLTAEVYSAGQEFLDSHDTDRGRCLLLDVQMPDMNGLELQQKLADNGSSLPVIIITGHGDVPIAVKALKAGAIDFIEKPFTDDVILSGVRRALEFSERNHRKQASVDEAKTGIGRLTPREYEVFEHLVVGRLNKQIAFDLGISTRTVEVHRARVMEKMRARNLAHLVRMALTLGIEPDIS